VDLWQIITATIRRLPFPEPSPTFLHSSALAPCELSERQAAELITAGEVFDLPVAIVTRDTTPENVPRQMVHHLRKYVLPGIHLSLRDKSIAKGCGAGQSSSR
jgi:hypothetical protein